MKTLREVFRYNLKRLRKEAGLEQLDFAAKLGIPFGTYQKLENSQGAIPQKATLTRIVKALKLPSETVLFQDPDLAPRSTSPASPEAALQVLAKALAEKRGRNKSGVVGEVVAFLSTLDEAKDAAALDAIRDFAFRAVRTTDHLLKDPEEDEESG